MWLYIQKLNNTYHEFIIIYYIAVQFLFTPSPNIGVYQLAHYHCSVDRTGVRITWLVNGTDYGYNEIIQPGIVTSGIPQHSNLTIHGYPQYNNTIVRCFAAGFVDGSPYNQWSISVCIKSDFDMFGKIAILYLPLLIVTHTS